MLFRSGNVLVRFDPRLISDGFGLPPRLEEAIFGTGLWSWSDSGLISTEELARLMCGFAGETDDTDVLTCQTVLEDFCRFMKPLEPASWLQDLKAAGKKLYYLTNYGAAAFEKTVERFSFFRYFDGGVVSSNVRMVKPMPAI